MARTPAQAREYMKKWRTENPEKKRNIAKRYRDSHREQIREKNKAYYLTLPPGKLAEQTQRYRRANPLRHLLSACKARAKRKGLPFDLVLGDLIVPEVCPVLGIPLFFSEKRGPNTPSIDRVDNTKGYTKDNILIVSLRVNHLKNNGTLAELRAIADFYVRFEAPCGR